MLPLIVDSLDPPSTIAYPSHQDGRPLIDALPGSALENIDTLTRVGLGDAFTWARTTTELSDGQRARFQIASLLGSGMQTIIVDDFTNGLDRLTAHAAAWTISKACRSRHKTLIVLTPHQDLAEHLQPDLHIQTAWQNEPSITWRKTFTRRSPVIDRITYERGTIQDWHALAKLHYAAGDPATTHSYHVLRHPDLAHPAAVAVLSFPDLHSAARNLATDDAYRIGGSRQQAMRLNREILKLSRIITCPEFRSIGLAPLLIDLLLPTLNVRYLECCTTMGRYTSFLQKIGFREIPQTAHRTEAALNEFVEINHLDEAALIDPEAFAALDTKLSVRKAREFRRIVWHYYHHFVLHRRTRRPVPKSIPAPGDQRWPEAFEIAAKRAIERPAYFILGPLDQARQHHPEIHSTNGNGVLPSTSRPTHPK